MMLSDEERKQIADSMGINGYSWLDAYAEKIERAVIAKASQQAQDDSELELEFTRIMSRINSVNFEFVNGEPEPAPRSGRSVPVILGVAWKVFKAVKAAQKVQGEPVQEQDTPAKRGCINMKFKMSEKDGLIRPVEKLDIPIFQHCSNNSIAVTEKFFYEFVEPLLFLHGIAFTECDWRAYES